MFKSGAFLLVLVLIAASYAAPPVDNNDGDGQTPTRTRAGITEALIGAGATLLGNGGGGSSTWQLPSGVKVDANSCWQDGGGACPNGNCLDNKGPRGVVIKETTVNCKFFCVMRGHCKTQICCKNA